MPFVKVKKFNEDFLNAGFNENHQRGHKIHGKGRDDLFFLIFEMPILINSAFFKIPHYLQESACLLSAFTR